MRNSWVRHHQVSPRWRVRVAPCCSLQWSVSLCMEPHGIEVLRCKLCDVRCCASQHNNGGGLRILHIQLACACMLLLFLIGMGMRARLLHQWASVEDEGDSTSSEQLLSLIGLVYSWIHRVPHRLLRAALRHRTHLSFWLHHVPRILLSTALLHTKALCSCLHHIPQSF